MKKIIIDDSKLTRLNCGCADWIIFPNDEKGVKEKPEDTVVDHDCSRITVFRSFLSVKRFFLTK